MRGWVINVTHYYCSGVSQVQDFKVKGQGHYSWPLLICKLVKQTVLVNRNVRMQIRTVIGHIERITLKVEGFPLRARQV